MRILFITSSRIGDAVLTTGVLAKLIEKYPQARITIASGDVSAPLFQHVPNLERFIEFRKKSGIGRWVDLWKETVGTKWDLVIDMRGSATSWFLFTKKRYVWTSNRNINHRAEHIAAVVGDPTATTTQLWTSSCEENIADGLLPKGKKILALAPAANWIGKQWEADKFAEAANRLIGTGGALEGATVAIFAAPHEKEMIQSTIDAIPAGQRLDLVNHKDVDLLTAYAIFKRSDLFIGNDSGLMHMAAASGCPTLGLFGPTRENNYGPWGRCTAVVRTPESTDELLKRKDEGVCLMGGLTIDKVVAGAEELLRMSEAQTLSHSQGPLKISA